MTDTFRHYRRWFYAAGVYNAVWGSAVVLFPGTLVRIAGMKPTDALPLVQVMGMMVGVYAYGYYLLAREPKRYCGFIWIALAGKTFGPLGFVYSASIGALPWSFATSRRPCARARTGLCCPHHWPAKNAATAASSECFVRAFCVWVYPRFPGSQ